MATPYICSACRSKLLRPTLRAACSISQTATRHRTSQARDEINRLLQDSNGRKQPANAEPRSAPSQYSNGNGSTIGRYSGKELRPEQLLNQLDQPGQTPSNGHATRRESREPRPPQRSNNSIQTDDVKSGNEAPYYARLSRNAEQYQTQLIAHANEGNFQGCWQALKLLENECGDIEPRAARTLYLNRDLIPSLQKLLHKATEQWLDGLAGHKHTPELPSPYDIHRILFRLRAISPGLYRPTLWAVASRIADLHYSNKLTSAPSGTVQSAVGLLVQMWRICMAIPVSFNRAPATTSRFIPASILADHTDWSFLPPAETFALSKSDTRSHSSFESMLPLILPMHSRQQIDQPGQSEYASAALITLDLVKSIQTEGPDGQSVPLSQLPEIAPFVRVLEAIFNAVPAPRIPTTLERKVARLEDPELLSQYESMIARLGLYDDKPQRGAAAAQNFQSEHQLTSGSNGGHDALGDIGRSSDDIEFAEKPRTPQIESFALLNVKRLGRALEARDMYQVEKIRREVYAFAGSHQDDPKAVPLELYEHLMLTFLSLRNPRAAIEIWNQIMTLGYRPTVKTYSVMMRGARTSKDRAGMEAFWHKMRQSGLQPDEHAWSIRIYGLFGLDAARQGMDALNEMSREWLAAAKAKATQGMPPAQSKKFAARQDIVSELLRTYPGPIDGVPRPNVVIVNSAISSLAQRRDYIISDVLKWSHAFGIEPDLTTFNALLNVSMRKGEATEAMNILHSMQKRGIQGDSTTWTVLLTALFHGGFLDGLDHLAQQKKILGFLEALESRDGAMSGVDEKGYALIINHLLKQYSNPTAADAVMNRMIASGRQPTTHIYTILLTYYFDTQPEPDLAAVQALWRHIESHNRGWGAVLDNMFYDRMIEGYARHHRLAGIQPALGFLKRARQAGQRNGWVALEAVSRALAERQQWDRLLALVDQVSVDMRENRGSTSNLGQRDFFAFIDQTGLLAGQESLATQHRRSKPSRDGPLVRAAAGAAEGAWSRSLSN